MHIENIQLTQFKNHNSSHFEFVNGVNCIVGKNGIGKSNLLDAIYYMCLTKSALQSQDMLNIAHACSFFSIKALFHKNDKQFKLLCALKSGERKLFKNNDKAYEKMSDHIGNFPCVMIIPDDMDIIKGGSENRRKFFDQLLCQLDRQYLLQLIAYTHILKQRNSLLKSALETGRLNQSLLETYDSQLLEPANFIFEKRKAFVNAFVEELAELYKQISDGSEKVSIKYESEMNEQEIATLLKDNYFKDKKSGRTNSGVHKDDFHFLMGRELIKKFGSQGQQKSYLLALKLAQYVSLKQVSKLKPILLMDDIFDKLDDLRIEKLLLLIDSDDYGQLFISDARPERSKEILSKLKRDVKFITLSEQQDEKE